MFELAKPDISNLVDFFGVSGKLKTTPRSGWVEVGIDAPESVADHTFRTAILCMIHSDLEGLDTLKMLQMALIHDLPEAFTGDLKPSERTNSAKEREEEAMKRLLRLLPEKQRDKYAEIWREYEEGETAESKAVKGLDKFEMALQAREYNSAKLDKQSLDGFLKSAEKAATSKTTKELLSHILDSRFESV